MRPFTANLLPPPAKSGARAAIAGRLRRARGVQDRQQHTFTPLIDAKAASRLLGVPHTWLLAQAREGRIPHHRLGHYVRFNPDDLKEWLAETRSGVGCGPRWHA
jgi:excisionase family DNA binding protein